MKAARIRALVFKELKLSKKAIIINTLIVVGAAALGWLFMLSSICGNLRRINDLNVKSEIYNIFRLAIPYAACCTLGGFVPNHTADVNAGWFRYSVGLPQNTWEIAASKLIVLIIRLIIAVVISTVDQIVLGAMYHKSFSLEFFPKLFILVDFFLLSIILEAVFVLSERTPDGVKKGSAKYTAAVCAVTMGATLLIMKKYMTVIRKYAMENETTGFSDMLPPDMVRDLNSVVEKLQIISIPLVFLILGIIFVMTAKRLKVREK